MKFLFLTLAFVLFFSCDNEILTVANNQKDDGEISDTPFYYGADLSYVNEMEDCGAVYYNQNGEMQDPYEIFADAGANLARFRLWHSPEWTDYSTTADVIKSIRRAKKEGMQVLLDFHYSDNWADPGKQEIPAAWVDVIDDTGILADSLYQYTRSVLLQLHEENLLPELVQVGNEINGMILQQGELEWPINWQRNSLLINAGIKAIRDLNEELDTDMEIMLHIAQPENGLWWFKQATENGVTDFDWIGLSYYPIWSEYTLDNVGQAFRTLVNIYNKPLMVVETAYPYTFEDADPAGNILGQGALVEGIEASPRGQLEYLNRLKNIIRDAGGSGLVYWEPAWVSTPCETQWGKGSHWDNATLFDHDYKAMESMNFYNGSQQEE